MMLNALILTFGLVGIPALIALYTELTCADSAAYDSYDGTAPCGSAA